MDEVTDEKDIASRNLFNLVMSLHGMITKDITVILFLVRFLLLLEDFLVSSSEVSHSF